jgi:hypothetical protein
VNSLDSIEGNLANLTNSGNRTALYSPLSPRTKEDRKVIYRSSKDGILFRPSKADHGNNGCNGSISSIELFLH